MITGQTRKMPPSDEWYERRSQATHALKARKNALRGRSPRPSSSADRVGVKVSALNSEIVIEHAIVSANCL